MRRGCGLDGQLDTGAGEVAVVGNAGEQPLPPTLPPHFTCGEQYPLDAPQDFFIATAEQRMRL